MFVIFGVCIVISVCLCVCYLWGVHCNICVLGDSGVYTVLQSGSSTIGLIGSLCGLVGRSWFSDLQMITQASAPESPPPEVYTTQTQVLMLWLLVVVG